MQRDNHIARGIELHEKGWTLEAINEFKNALKVAPHSSQCYDNLATVYAENGQLLEALHAYNQSLRLDPDNIFALHNLGCFLSNYGSRLAAHCFKSAFTADPEFFESRFNFGLCLAAEDKHEKAVNQFLKALEVSPDDEDIRFHLALSYFCLEKYPLAIKELKAILKTNDQHVEAWHSLGQSYQEQGFVDEAINAFTKTLAIEKERVDSILALASLIKSKNRHKEALALIKRAKLLDPKKTSDFLELDENEWPEI